MTHVQQSVIPHLSNQMAQMQLSSGGVRYFLSVTLSIEGLITSRSSVRDFRDLKSHDFVL